LADSQITMKDIVIVCRTVLVLFDDKGHDSTFALRGVFGLTVARRTHRVTLGIRYQRAGDHRAAEKRDEIVPPYESIRRGQDRDAG
jgi:hypothetical protein